MKLSKILSLVLAVALVFSAFQIFAFAAEEEACCGSDITVIVQNDVSPEVEAKIHAYFHGEEAETAASGARGLICDLFGHKIETGTTSTITHKVRTTAPRCLETYYNYEICSRCDEYSVMTKTGSVYIPCCA